MRHIPNLLSASRLIAAPYLFWLLWTREYRTVLVWFAVIGLTDGLDGYLARRLHATSRLGAMLDPVADKVLLSGAFLVLAITGTIPLWLAGLVLGRDAAILLFAVGMLALAKTRRDFPPTLGGKLSTALQIVYVLLATGAAADLLHPALPSLAQWPVVFVTAWSGVDYARRVLPQRES